MQNFRDNSGLAEISILLGYDATSLGTWFLTFDDKASCHSRTETLRYVFFQRHSDHLSNGIHVCCSLSA